MKLPRNSFLNCSHICKNPGDIETIKAFEVLHPETGKGLEIYLKQKALLDEQEDMMRTYLVRWEKTNECAGYFSLKAGLISINENDKPDDTVFDTIPGVEIANFALNRFFVQKYKMYGLGGMFFRQLIAPFILEHARTLGISMVYLFALPLSKLIKRYESYGFRRLNPQDEELLHRRLKPAYDHSCIFMYQTLASLRSSLH